MSLGRTTLEVDVWIELHDSARDHPKTLKVARELGIEKVHAFGHICSLWTWALRMAPDGDLSSFDDDDIEIGAEWSGDRGAFVAALSAHKLLDKNGRGYVLHDWFEYATHLKAAERKRKERARKADASHPVTGSHVTSHDVTGQARISGHVTQTDRPTDRQNRTEPTEPTDASSTQRVVKRTNRSEEIGQVFDHYRSLHPRSHRKPKSTSKEWRKIRERLDEGYTVEDLKLAIDGCHRTPHNMGDNDRGHPYLGLELIMRTGDQVTRFIENYTRFAPGGQLEQKQHFSEKTRRTIEAGQRWLARSKENDAQ